MLGLFGSKSDHPLASLKSVQQLLDNLPRADMVAALEEIGHSIQVLFEEENDFRLDHQFAALRLLDEAAHPLLRKVTQAYFAAAPITSFQENRLWGVLNAYFTFSEIAYHRILTGIRDGEKGGSAIRSQIALVSARGIYAIFGRMECAAVRYMPIDQQAWVHLADLYDHAAVEQCEDDELLLYAGGLADTTVNRIFASVVMWYSTSVGALRPLDLHIAKCLIVHMRKFLHVADEPAADSMFIFDLAHPLDPARVKDEGAMYPPSTRFVSISVPAGFFEGLLKTLSKDIVPDNLNFGVAYSAELVTEVVLRVSSYCKLPLPTRRHQRRKLKMNVKILNGFDSLVELSGVDFHLDAAGGEECEVEDISATGLKYIIQAAKVKDVAIGSLIGLQPDKAGHWGAGVVRRLRRDAQNNLHVGVKILANKVVGVQLQEGDGSLEGNRHAALLVERSDDASGENWLLLKSDTYSANRSPMLTRDGKDFLLLPLGIVEKGSDFDLVRYRRMVHDAGGDA